MGRWRVCGGAWREWIPLFQGQLSERAERNISFSKWILIIDSYALVTYIVSPYQTWGVFSVTSSEGLWKEIGQSTVFFDSFDRDFIREDENRPEYIHEVTGEPSTSNFFVNRFYIPEGNRFAALELGMTNDFVSVRVSINNIAVFEY